MLSLFCRHPPENDLPYQSSMGMNISSFVHSRIGRPEERSLVSSTRPVLRDDSIASSRTEQSKALPDAPLTFAQRWRRFWERPLLNSWLAEILALTFSTACLISIIVVLRVYDSKTIPEIPFGLTLNAIVSILAAGSKSSLLLAVAGAISQLKWSWFATQRRKLEDIQEFDDASRGPWGSVTLLFTINVRSLASIGALITILTLAYDPFVQQVLIYPVRVIEQASNETTTVQALVWVPDANTPEFGNALNAGVWSDETAFARDPACPSGNCNWPIFRSMGWCSKCEDIADRIELDDCPFNWFFDRNTSGPTLRCNLTFDGNPSTRFAWGDMVRRVTYDEANKSNNTSWYPEGEVLSQISWPVRVSSSGSGPTILGVRNPALVFGFVSLWYLNSGQDWDPVTGYGNITPSVRHAEQCVLTPCARTYNVSTANGKLRADVVDENYGYQKTYTIKQINNAMSPFNTQDIYCWQPDEGNLTWHYIEPVGPTNARSGLYNPWIPSVAERFENVTSSGFCSLFDYQDRIVNTLNGSASLHCNGWIPGEGKPELWEWLDKYPYSNWGWSPEYSSPAIQKMATSNLTTVVNSIAASLTKLGLDLSNVTVYGNVSMTENYVHAEWKWLIFPIALESLGIMLLVTTIIMSRLQRTKLWKSSVLPLLYHGLDDSVARSQTPPQDIFGMEELARMSKVKLVNSQSDDRIVFATS